jgi:hypothetical protein
MNLGKRQNSVKAKFEQQAYPKVSPEQSASQKKDGIRGRAPRFVAAA